MKKMIVAAGLVGFASLVGVEVGMAQVLTYHLEGLESFQVEARFGWSTDVIGLTEDAVRTRAELELGRNGIAVSDNAPARLIVGI